MLSDIELMAVIRDVDPEYVIDIVKILMEEGVACLEISLSEPVKGFKCIERVNNEFGQSSLLVGAGTVTRKREIDRLKKLGTGFILTPGFDGEITDYAIRQGIEVLPGVLTPSEVQQALKHGIRLLKLFPADAFDTSYIRSLKGPFPETECIAVGGVNESNIREFLDAGFKGVAIGGNLVPRGAGPGDYGQIRKSARIYRAALSERR